MGYASILTIMRPDRPDTELTGYFDFCAAAHLQVLVAAQAPPSPISAYDMAGGTAWLEATEQARSWAEERAREVEALLAASEQRGDVTAHVAGPLHLSDLVANASRCTDLVLMPVAASRDTELDHAVINGALFESGAPVLVFPAAAPPAARPATALIAWKATPEGGRAVRAALPMLKQAGRVVVLLIDPQPGARGHGAEPGANLASYLGHHGIGVEVSKVPSEGRSAEDEIARQVTAQDAGLLVMGAYGHSRLRERIFGGTTQSMLEAPPCPVLLAH